MDRRSVAQIEMESNRRASSRAVSGRAPLSDIRARLSNLKNCGSIEGDSAAPKHNEIWRKSIALAEAHSSQSSMQRSSALSIKESSASLDVDALLLRRAKRKELRQSMHPPNNEERMEGTETTTPIFRAQEDVECLEPPSIISTHRNLSPSLSQEITNATPQHHNPELKSKSNALLYETGIKLKSAEERIDHLMKEMEELRIFANISSQIQNEEDGNYFTKNQLEIEVESSLQEENQLLMKELCLRDQQLRALQQGNESSKVQSAIKIEAAHLQINELTCSLREAQSRSQYLEEQLDETALNYSKTTKHLRASLEDAKKKIEVLEDDLETAIEQKASELCKKKQIEIETITAQYNDQIEKLLSDLETWKSKYSALEDSIQSKNSSIEEYSKSLIAVQLDLEAMQCEINRLVKLEESYRLLEERHSELHNELRSVQRNHDIQIHDLESKLKEADKNYEKLQADFDVSERENDDLARAIEEIEEQNSDIEGIVEAYENDLCELRSSVKKLNVSVQQAEYEKESAQKQVDLIRTENESLVGKLAENNLALQAYKKEFHSKFLEMKEQYMEMEQLYSRSKREHNQLQSDYLMEIKNLNAINRSLQGDRNSLQSAIELYKSKIAELEAFRKYQEPSRVLPTSLQASQGVKTSSARQKVFGILDENSVCSSFDRDVNEVEALERYP